MIRLMSILSVLVCSLGANAYTQQEVELEKLTTTADFKQELQTVDQSLSKEVREFLTAGAPPLKSIADTLRMPGLTRCTPEAYKRLQGRFSTLQLLGIGVHASLAATALQSRNRLLYWQRMGQLARENKLGSFPALSRYALGLEKLPEGLIRYPLSNAGRNYEIATKALGRYLKLKGEKDQPADIVSKFAQTAPECMGGNATSLLRSYMEMDRMREEGSRLVNYLREFNYRSGALPLKPELPKVNDDPVIKNHDAWRSPYVVREVNGFVGVYSLGPDRKPSADDVKLGEFRRSNIKAKPGTLAQPTPTPIPLQNLRRPLPVPVGGKTILAKPPQPKPVQKPLAKPAPKPTPKPVPKKK